MLAAVLRRGWWVALGALAVSYALLAHYTNTAAQAHTRTQALGTSLALAPFALIAFSMAWNSGRRKIMLPAFFIAGAVLFAGWRAIAPHFSDIYWLEHAGTQSLLCFGFARTLRAGKEPLCTYFARLVHGTLPPPVERYTRSITVAWACFFGLMAATSTILYYATPLATWSAFANFFTGPLIALMFIVEYVVRRILHPNMEHVHILDSVKLFWKSPAR